MQVVTYATNKAHPHLAHLANKLEIKILPEYLPWAWDFYPKAYSVNKFVSNLHFDELVLSMDAYDIFALNGCSKAKLEQKIKEHFDLDKVTFCAETNCFPDASLASRYPNINSDWKYLNGGIYVGKAGLIKQMLDLTLKKMRGNMDQLQFAYLFLESNLINIDSGCKVFQSLYRKEYGKEICWNDYDIEGKTITNKYLKTQPLLFHGNGLIKMHDLIPYIL